METPSSLEPPSVSHSGYALKREELGVGGWGEGHCWSPAAMHLHLERHTECWGLDLFSSNQLGRFYRLALRAHIKGSVLIIKTSIPEKKHNVPFSFP